MQVERPFLSPNSNANVIGMVYIKIVMPLFLAVPIVCALIGASGPLAVI